MHLEEQRGLKSGMSERLTKDSKFSVGKTGERTGLANLGLLDGINELVGTGTACRTWRGGISVACSNNGHG